MQFYLVIVNKKYNTGDNIFWVWSKKELPKAFLLRRNKNGN